MTKNIIIISYILLFGFTFVKADIINDGSSINLSSEADIVNDDSSITFSSDKEYLTKDAFSLKSGGFTKRCMALTVYIWKYF